MRYKYTPVGVCSDEISFDIEDGKLGNIEFSGGCNGNLQAISRLGEGVYAQEFAELLKDIDCDGRGTSCADQFAVAILKCLNETS